MSSGNAYERLWRVQASVNDLVLNGKRDPEVVSDVLQSVIDGRVTAAVDKSAPLFETTEKFALLADLGIITVPDYYSHAECLKSFRDKSGKEFSHFRNEINDANFPDPTHILRRGQKLHVSAYMQVVKGTTTSEERMAFLATRKAMYVGAQGASLVFNQRREELRKGKWYASFDEEGRLWKDSGGHRQVPIIHCDSDGDFEFILHPLATAWRSGNAFLCFNHAE